MEKQRIQVLRHHDVEIIRLEGGPVTMEVLLADVEAAIAKYHQEHRLVARKRTVHGLEQYWIGRGKGKDFVLYHDIYSPTGYGFRGKAKAEQIASEIEERLRKDREERKQSW